MTARRRDVPTIQRWCQAWDCTCRTTLQGQFATAEKPSHLYCRRCRKEYAICNVSRYPLLGMEDGECKYFTEVKKEG
jgi:hypothetical protein